MKKLHLILFLILCSFHLFSQYMKRFFLIWLFIPFISYCQNDHEFKLQNVSQKYWDDFCISKMDCFSLSFDTVYFDYCILFYSYEEKKKQMIDTVFSQMLYDYPLSSFESQANNSHVVFWEIGGEHGPFFYAYYIKDGKLTKIGKWIMVEPCDTCDYFDYSLNDIRIFHKNDEIEFLFLKETSFFVGNENYDYDDWGLFKAGELVVSFNIANGTVRRVEKRK